jgi:hypothetical protein
LRGDRSFCSIATDRSKVAALLPSIRRPLEHAATTAAAAINTHLEA